MSEQQRLLNKQSLSPQQTYESLSPGSPRRPRTIVSNLRLKSVELHRSSTPVPSIFSQSSQTSLPSNFEKLSLAQRLPYYLPCYSWLPTYDFEKFFGDFVAGLTLASFQIPLALSYATSVAHVPALCGLYSLAIPPIIYAIFGSVPQMIVGPEGAISLVIGQAVERLTAHSNEYDPVDLVSVLSVIGGFYLLGAGLLRLGFLDNVLSRALLRGFISSVGFVMIINSLWDELGLGFTYKGEKAHFHSPLSKFYFMLTHFEDVHRPTAWISLISFGVMFAIGLAKKRFIAKGKKHWVYVPEILIVVLVSTLMSDHYDWRKIGVAVVGKIETKGFTYNSPLRSEALPLYKTLMSSGFLAATLGFFESTTASKSLGSAFDLPISSNRELVALGAINIFGGFIGALPAFGGYGRSKINAMSGAKTTFSGLVMGSITLVTIFCLLKFVVFLPICVLSVITTTVGIKLLDETPSDLKFHWRARGYSELVTFCITFLVALFYSMEAGITLGVAHSVILVIKNSTFSRIQILGRLPGTAQFFNADEPLPEEYGDVLEEIEGCLIVKISEPLTFSNTSDLKARLLRLERYGSVHTHPAAPRIRQEEMNRNVIFDLNGLSLLDSSASQIFSEILVSYKNRGIRVFFTRVPTRRHIRERLKDSGIYDLADKKYYGTIEEVLQIIDQEEAESLARSV